MSRDVQFKLQNIADVYEVKYDPHKYPIDKPDEPKWYPSGPGRGFDYHGGYLFPHTRFPTEELAKQVTILLNEAYCEGYTKAQKDMRNALGIE